jgi:hypothetical protein
MQQTTFLWLILTFKSRAIHTGFKKSMDVMSKIAIGAGGTIAIIIIGLGFYYITSNENEARCEEMRKSVNEHLIAHNQSVADYDYRVNRLHGHFDLPGDLLAWNNFLVNDWAQLNYEIANLEDSCEFTAR